MALSLIKQNAYWSWVCTTAFPIFYPLAKLPPLDGGEESAILITASAATTTSPPPSLIKTTETSVDTVESHDQLRNVSSSLHRASPTRPKTSAAKATPTGIFVLERVPACMTWCTQVETLCPYFNPSDSTSNGGEPTFLCDGTRSISTLLGVCVRLKLQVFGCLSWQRIFTFYLSIDEV